MAQTPYNPAWGFDSIFRRPEEEEEELPYQPDWAMPMEDEVPEAQVVPPTEEYRPDFSFDAISAGAQELVESGYTPEPETPVRDWFEGRGANIDAIGHSALAAGSELVAAPARAFYGAALGKDPAEIDINIGDFEATKFADDQREELKIDRARQAALTPEGPVGKFFTEVLDSTVAMGPAVAATYLTKNPTLGLNMMGAQVFTTTYAQSRAEGKDVQESITDAGVAVAAEIGSEKAMGVFDDFVFGRSVKDLLFTAAKEGASEVITEAATIVDETQRQGMEAPGPVETLGRLGYAGAAGAVMGGGLALPGAFGKKTPEDGTTLPEFDLDDAPIYRDPDDPDLAPLLEDTPALQQAKQMERAALDQAGSSEQLELNLALNERIDASRAAQGDTAADPLVPESLEEIKEELSQPVEVPEAVPQSQPAEPEPASDRPSVADWPPDESMDRWRRFSSAVENEKATTYTTPELEASKNWKGKDSLKELVSRVIKARAGGRQGDYTEFTKAEILRLAKTKSLGFEYDLNNYRSDPPADGSSARGPINYKRLYEDIANDVMSQHHAGAREGGITDRLERDVMSRPEFKDVLDDPHIARNKEGRFAIFNETGLKNIGRDTTGLAGTFNDPADSDVIKSDVVVSPKMDIADTPHLEKVTTALNEALGSYSSLVTVVGANHQMAVDKDGNQRAGFYDPRTGKAHVIVRKGTRPASAVRVAWHELYHKGFDNNFNPVSSESRITPDSTAEEVNTEFAEFEQRKAAFTQTLKMSGENRTVDRLAKAIAKRRKLGRSRSLEEALVELGAAMETGNTAFITGHGVIVPKEMLTGKPGFIKRMTSRLADFYKRLMGKAEPEVLGYTDRQIFDLLRQTKRSVKQARAKYDGDTHIGTKEFDSVVASSPVSGKGSGKPKKSDAPPDPTPLTREGMGAEKAASKFPGDLARVDPTTMPEVEAEAKRIFESDPLAGHNLQNNILNDINYVPSIIDLAVLRLYKSQLQQTRNLMGDKAGTAGITPEVRADWLSKWAGEEAALDGLRDAIAIAAGRLGQSFRYLQEDTSERFSEEQMLRRVRIVYQGEMDSEAAQAAVAEAKKVAAELAAQAAELEKRYQAEQEAADEIKFAELAKALEKTVKAPQPAKAPAAQKPQLMDKWKESAENSRKALEAALKGGRFNAIAPDLMAHVANIGAYEMANGAVEIVKWLKAFKNNVGAELFGVLENDIQDIYAESLKRHESQQTAVPKVGKEETLAKIHAKALIGDPLSHREVYNLAKYHVEQGVRGEKDLMAALLADLQTVVPNVTEGEIRRAFVDYGKTVTPTPDEIRAELNEISSLLLIREHIERLEKGLDPLKKGSKHRKDTALIKERKRQLALAMRLYEHKHPHAAANRLLGVNERREAALRARIQDIKTRLEGGEGKKALVPVEDSAQVTKLRIDLEKLQDELAHQVNANKMDPAIYDQQVANRLRRNLRTLNRRLENKDYRVPPKKEKKPKVSAETQKLQFEHDEKKAAWLLEVYQQQNKMDPWYKKTGRAAMRFSTTTRAVKTSYDVSAFGRQGAVALAAHPQLAPIALKAQAAAALSAEKAARIDHDILTSDTGMLAKRSGVFFNDPHSTRLEKQEEAYMNVRHNNMFYKWTGIAASARAYNTGLNVIRHEYFNLLVDKLTVNGMPLTEKELKHIAYWVNRATGRGTVGESGKGDAIGAVLFFAPRWVQSRFSILSGFPLISAPTASWRVFRLIGAEYIKAFSGLTALNVLIAAAFLLASGEDLDEWDDLQIGTDPSSSDFMKIRVGKTRIDFIAGFAQQAVFVYRLASGTTTNSKGKTIDWRGDNRNTEQTQFWRIIERYGRSKLAPLPGALSSGYDGQDFMGNETNLLKEFIKLPIPLSMSEIFSGELVKEHDEIGTIVALQFLNFIGAGTNTYTDNYKDGSGGLFDNSSANIFGESAFYEGSSKGLFKED